MAVHPEVCCVWHEFGFISSSSHWGGGGLVCDSVGKAEKCCQPVFWWKAVLGSCRSAIHFHSSCSLTTLAVWSREVRPLLLDWVIPMVALTRLVCFLFFWSRQLMFWPFVSLWCFGGPFVWVAFLCAGELLISPQIPRVYLLPQWLITDQFPWYLYCPKYLRVSCLFVLDVYGMQRCASNTQFAYRKGLRTCDSLLCVAPPYRLLWRWNRRLEKFRLPSVLLLTGLTIKRFSSSTLDNEWCLFWHRLSLVSHSMSWWMVVIANWLKWRQGCLREVFWGHSCSSCTPWSIPKYCKTSSTVMLTTLLWLLLCNLLRRAKLFQSLYESWSKHVSVWCDVWRRKLNASKIKTMIVSMLHTVHLRLTGLWMELWWRNLLILSYFEWRVMLIKMTVEKDLRSDSSAAAQMLGVRKKSWQVFHDRSLLLRSFWSFVLPVLEYWSSVVIGCRFTS